MFPFDFMKPTIQKFLFPSVTLLAASLATSGCYYEHIEHPAGVPATQVGVRDAGFVAGTGIESQDIVAVTDKMAAGILALPQFNNVSGQAPCLAVLPVKNETSFPINQDIFTTRIEDALAEKAPGRMRFLARDRMAELQHELDLKRTGQVTSSTDPSVVAFKGVDYFLTGTLISRGTSTSAGRSDYILYSFQLIDPNTSVEIWRGSAEIKKQGTEDAVYR